MTASDPAPFVPPGEPAKPQAKKPEADWPSLDPVEKDRSARPPDPFDPESLRLGQDFTVGAATKKIVAKVPVRKPDRRWFFRTRADEGWSLTTAVFESHDDRETYLVAPAMRSELADEISIVTLFTAINAQDLVFLWPVRLPSADGRSNSWHETALTAAQKALTQWVSVRSNMAAGMYDVLSPVATIPDPKWPEDLTFDQALKLGFSGRLIDSPDHPVVRKLRGESW